MPDPPGADAPSDSLAVIAIVYSMPEAAVLVATLNAYGIFALPGNRWHISLQPLLMVALGGIRVSVPCHRAEDALALLEAIDTGWRAPAPPLRRRGLAQRPPLDRPGNPVPGTAHAAGSRPLRVAASHGWLSYPVSS